MEPWVDKPDFPTFARLWQGIAPVRNWARARARLSVRAVMVLVLVIGGGLGWLERGARIQRQAIAAIKDAGGRCTYDLDWRENPVISGTRPPANPWLVRHVDVNYVANVADISLVPRSIHDTTKANDLTLAAIGKLNRLESLSLNRTAVTDAGLVHLKDMTWLKNLELWDTQITDAGLEHLRGLTGLQCLFLKGTHVTDRGVQRLQDALPGVQIIR